MHTYINEVHGVVYPALETPSPPSVSRGPGHRNTAARVPSDADRPPNRVPDCKNASMWDWSSIAVASSKSVHVSMRVIYET